jgi:hypothetical protein
VITAIAVRLAGWLGRLAIFKVFEGRPGIHPTQWTQEIMDYLRDGLRDHAVIATVVAWLTLRLLGRWEPEKAWDDRLGRLIGLP